MHHKDFFCKQKNSFLWIDKKNCVFSVLQQKIIFSAVQHGLDRESLLSKTEIPAKEHSGTFIIAILIPEDQLQMQYSKLLMLPEHFGYCLDVSFNLRLEVRVRI